MSYGNNEVIKKLRDVIQNGGGIDVNTRDVLLFSAIIDMYEQLEKSRNETQSAIAEARSETKRVIDETRPAIVFYRVGIWFASALGLSIIGLFFALMTGRAEIIFK
jgi:hypothetical protein